VARLRRISAAGHAPVGTGTAAEAERGDGADDAPIDVAGLAHELDEIRNRK